MDHNQKASLGCGTLILIALIVLIFGNLAGSDAEKEIKKLSQEAQTLSQQVQTLQSTVYEQTRAIKRLEETVSHALERDKKEVEKK
jgi:outer membrane murein-binding lipoprotein Lpp